MKIFGFLLNLFILVNVYAEHPELVIQDSGQTITTDMQEEAGNLQLEKERKINEMIHQQEELSQEVRMRKIFIYGGIATFILALLSLFYFLKKNSD